MTPRPDHPVVQANAVVAALELVATRHRSHTASVALGAALVGAAYARSRTVDDRELAIQYVHELRRVESDASALGASHGSASMRGLQLAQSLLYVLLDASIDGRPFRCPIMDEASRLAELACTPVAA